MSGATSKLIKICLELHKTLEFLRFFVCRCLAALACNVSAAWRQAGVSLTLGREQTMMLPAHFQTSQHPRLRQTARCELVRFLPNLLSFPTHQLSKYSNCKCMDFMLIVKVAENLFSKFTIISKFTNLFSLKKRAKLSKRTNFSRCYLQKAGLARFLREVQFFS